MNIVLCDDGSLDTVHECTDCKETFRSSFSQREDDQMTYEDFLREEVEYIEANHECRPDVTVYVEGNDVKSHLRNILQEYIEESEHQDGIEYWDRFSTLKDVRKDVGRWFTDYDG